jgi:hypothetical protein
MGLLSVIFHEIYQFLHFIALEPTVKNILSIKISIFYSSTVLKLLQQKYKLQEDAVRK